MASPILPVTQLTPLTKFMVYAFPEESAAVVPLPSSNFHQPTKPDEEEEEIVRVVEPLIEPDAAEIVVLPVATPVASPPLEIVAAAVFVELQVTELVRFWVLLSL